MTPPTFDTPELVDFAIDFCRDFAYSVGLSIEYNPITLEYPIDKSRGPICSLKVGTMCHVAPPKFDTPKLVHYVIDFYPVFVQSVAFSMHYNPITLK